MQIAVQTRLTALALKRQSMMCTLYYVLQYKMHLHRCFGHAMLQKRQQYIILGLLKSEIDPMLGPFHAPGAPEIDPMHGLSNSPG